MLMQILAWVIGIPVVVLLLAYAAIFAALLAARLRQAQGGFVQGTLDHAAYPGVREAAGKARDVLDSRLH